MREYIITVLVLTLYGVAGSSVPEKPDKFINKTVDLTTTNMTSPGYESDMFYHPNTTWHYRFTTNYPNHTLVLTINEFSLEKEDKNHYCYYDKLTIYDGFNESFPELVTLCDNKTAGTTFLTSGKFMFAIFESDHDNEFKGFSIGVRSDGPTSTTSTTTTSTTSTTTTSTTTTTTTKPPTTTPSIATTTRSNDEGSKNNDNTSLIIIIGSAVGGLLLLILLVVLIICCIKSKKRPQSAFSEDSNTKRVLWSRSNTLVQPLDFSKTTVPPGEIIQVKTNLFDLDLPTGHGKANQLPPISSQIP